MAFDGNTIGAATSGAFTGNGFSDTFALAGSDVDIVALTLDAGQHYAFDVDNGATGDLYLRIFDRFGNEVKSNDDGNRAADDVLLGISPYTEFQVNYAGTYYVAISPYYLPAYDPFTTQGRIVTGNPLLTTNGTLTVTRLSDALWSDADTTGAITTEGASDETDVTASARGSTRIVWQGDIDAPTDIDLARLDLTKGDVVVVETNGLAANGTVLRVFLNDLQIAFDDDSGTGEDAELVFVASTTGTYAIGVSGDGNTGYGPNGGAPIAPGETGGFEIILHVNPTQIGTASPNTLSGDETPNHIVGQTGADTITGNGGRDTLAGGDDNDVLSGGNENDVLYGDHGNDVLNGDKGTDVLQGGLGDDTMDGGKQADLLDGGTGNDSMTGGEGGFGDTLRGGDGLDTLRGSAGDDLLQGEQAGDMLVGDTGIDTLEGGDGDDTLDGGADGDSLVGATGLDSLLGAQGDDTLDGGANNDILSGDIGNDVLSGGFGADALYGGRDNDTLTGGLGNDTLNGGAGVDRFVFAAAAEALDVIEDFLPAADVIDLSAIFAATGAVVTAANLANFVQCTPSGAGTDSFLAVDANGTVGGLSFTIIAQVNGVGFATLFDFGNFAV